MDFKNHNAISWHQNQGKKRKDNYENNQIALINKNLQNILYQIEREVDKSKVELQEKHINRQLVSCHIWRIGYVDNFQNKKIALEQGVFIQLLLQLFDLERSKHIEVSVDQLMLGLGNIEWQLYIEYARRKQAIRRLSNNIELEITKTY